MLWLVCSFVQFDSYLFVIRYDFIASTVIFEPPTVFIIYFFNRSICLNPFGYIQPYDANLSLIPSTIAAASSSDNPSCCIICLFTASILFSSAVLLGVR